MPVEFHATTIFAVRHDGQCAMSGDGQVTMGNAVVMKHKAKKFLIPLYLCFIIPGVIYTVYWIFANYAIALDDKKGKMPLYDLYDLHINYLFNYESKIIPKVFVSKIFEISKKVFKLLKCKGMARLDFIIKNNDSIYSTSIIF